jgi:hypothetical protein
LSAAVAEALSMQRQHNTMAREHFVMEAWSGSPSGVTAVDTTVMASAALCGEDHATVW